MKSTTIEHVTSRNAVSKGALWTGRVLSSLIVLFMLLDGVMKIVPPEPVLKACAELGIPLASIPWIGATLVTSTLLYAIPQTSILGAILLTAYLGGATATHILNSEPLFNGAFAIGFGVLTWLALCLRDPRLWKLIPLRQFPARA